MRGDPHLWDRAMEFAGAMSRLSQGAEALTGEKIQNVIVDVQHPPFAVREETTGTSIAALCEDRPMWRWGTFSGVVIWSQD